MPRCNHQQKVRLNCEDRGPRLEQCFFLTVERATGDHKTKALCLGLKQIGCARPVSAAHIEFQISGHRNALRQTADRLQPLRVQLALRQHVAELAEKRPPEPAQPAVARPRAVGDAGVNHCDGDPAAEAAIEEVGPEFGFGQDEETGFQRVQVRAHGPGQVKRAIEDTVGTESRTCQTLPSAGCGGNYDSITRQCPVEFRNQAADGQHFAD